MWRGRRSIGCSGLPKTKRPFRPNIIDSAILHTLVGLCRPTPTVLRTVPGWCPSTTPYNSGNRFRKRLHMTRITVIAKWGVSWTMKLNCLSFTGTTLQAVFATAVALRGDLSTSAISPRIPCVGGVDDFIVDANLYFALKDHKHRVARFALRKDDLSRLIGDRVLGPAKKIEDEHFDGPPDDYGFKLHTNGVL